MKFNGVEITQETILKTRLYFCENSLTCIRSAVEYGTISKDELPEGKFFVNDLLKYMLMQNQYQEEIDDGQHDHTFAFLQHAYWLQTGEMVALLP